MNSAVGRREKKAVRNVVTMVTIEMEGNIPRCFVWDNINLPVLIVATYLMILWGILC